MYWLQDKYNYMYLFQTITKCITLMIKMKILWFLYTCIMLNLTVNQSVFDILLTTIIIIIIIIILYSESKYSLWDCTICIYNTLIAFIRIAYLYSKCTDCRINIIICTCFRLLPSVSHSAIHVVLFICLYLFIYICI
jgi:hypothetical protein